MQVLIIAYITHTHLIHFKVLALLLVKADLVLNGLRVFDAVEELLVRPRLGLSKHVLTLVPPDLCLLLLLV
jgi:hypothetical protein